MNKNNLQKAIIKHFLKIFFNENNLACFKNLYRKENTNNIEFYCFIHDMIENEKQEKKWRKFVKFDIRFILTVYF